ncbi:hypothetical protein FACS1894139_11280 [Planctomycetales bacterium]|nr:hypothetical protein FACS1894107_09770 [Planctomycetales bacterium]GHS98368.1 hypothetical protein FACS1894108_06400 [Planctomycetales bacterium]GHT06131.1 hypothetical protein FACS1894139_11280 [Planctomycetales bacterium]GHV20802.1 hypothetical protein AGMMS49959_08870 [Planctomycetales bacterium]
MDDLEKPILDAALEVQNFCESQQWRFAFIGALAVIRWGRPRTTKDIDGTLLTQFRDEGKYIDSALAHFKSRVDGADAKEFMWNRRVLLLTASNGVGVDLSLGGLWYEEKIIDHSSTFEFAPGYDLRTCSAEDLIITKSFAARDKDWADVRTILQRQHGKLDLNYVLENLRPLCELKEEPEIVNKLRQMVEQEDRRVI